eukprot:8383188-Alexandrium_andersonii.AAC.1
MSASRSFQGSRNSAERRLMFCKTQGGATSSRARGCSDGAGTALSDVHQTPFGAFQRSSAPASVVLIFAGHPKQHTLLGGSGETRAKDRKRSRKDVHA